jgi:hypothetical protein
VCVALSHSHLPFCAHSLALTLRFSLDARTPPNGAARAYVGRIHVCKMTIPGSSKEVFVIESMKDMPTKDKQDKINSPLLLPSLAKQNWSKMKTPLRRLCVAMWSETRRAACALRRPVQLTSAKVLSMPAPITVCADSDRKCSTPHSGTRLTEAVVCPQEGKKMCAQEQCLAEGCQLSSYLAPSSARRIQLSLQRRGLLAVRTPRPRRPGFAKRILPLSWLFVSLKTQTGLDIG